jgi:hypothetical protein
VVTPPEPIIQGIIRLEPDGFGVVADGFAILFQTQVSNGSELIGQGEIGLESDRFGVIADGFTEVAVGFTVLFDVGLYLMQRLLS